MVAMTLRLRARVLSSVVAVGVVASFAACDQDPCGDINTLDIATGTSACFAITYTCTATPTIVQSTSCGSGTYSDFALNIGTNALCTIQVNCPDGTSSTFQATWTLNSANCAPVLVSGAFDGTVCAGDGGVVPTPDASDASDTPSE